MDLVDPFQLADNEAWEEDRAREGQDMSASKFDLQECGVCKEMSTIVNLTSSTLKHRMIIPMCANCLDKMTSKKFSEKPRVKLMETPQEMLMEKPKPKPKETKKKKNKPIGTIVRVVHLTKCGICGSRCKAQVRPQSLSQGNFVPMCPDCLPMSQASSDAQHNESDNLQVTMMKGEDGDSYLPNKIKTKVEPTSTLPVSKTASRPPLQIPPLDVDPKSILHLSELDKACSSQQLKCRFCSLQFLSITEWAYHKCNNGEEYLVGVNKRLDIMKGLLKMMNVETTGKEETADAAQADQMPPTGPTSTPIKHTGSNVDQNAPGCSTDIPSTRLQEVMIKFKEELEEEEDLVEDRDTSTHWQDDDPAIPKTSSGETQNPDLAFVSDLLNGFQPRPDATNGREAEEENNPDVGRRSSVAAGVEVKEEPISSDEEMMHGEEERMISDGVNVEQEEKKKEEERSFEEEEAIRKCPLKIKELSIPCLGYMESLMAACPTCMQWVKTMSGLFTHSCQAQKQLVGSGIPDLVIIADQVDGPRDQTGQLASSSDDSPVASSHVYWTKGSGEEVLSAGQHYKVCGVCHQKFVHSVPSNTARLSTGYIPMCGPCKKTIPKVQIKSTVPSVLAKTKQCVWCCETFVPYLNETIRKNPNFLPMCVTCRKLHMVNAEGKVGLDTFRPKKGIDYEKVVETCETMKRRRGKQSSTLIKEEVAKKMDFTSNSVLARNPLNNFKKRCLNPALYCHICGNDFDSFDGLLKHECRADPPQGTISNDDLVEPASFTLRDEQDSSAGRVDVDEVRNEDLTVIDHINDDSMVMAFPCCVCKSRFNSLEMLESHMCDRGSIFRVPDGDLINSASGSSASVDSVSVHSASGDSASEDSASGGASIQPPGNLADMKVDVCRLCNSQFLDDSTPTERRLPRIKIPMCVPCRMKFSSWTVRKSKAMDLS